MLVSMWACNPHRWFPPSGRRRASLFLAVLGFALLNLAAPCRADIIHLKNGRTIVAATTREDSKTIYYESGGGEYSIPRSVVDRIEKSDAPPPEAPAGSSASPATGKRSVPLPTLPGVEFDARR